MSTTQNATSTATKRTDQEMSVFIPRVFGDTREQIEEVIKLRFDQEGLGIVERVDFHQGAKGLSAFVHFLQWQETPEATALQGRIRACSAGTDHAPPRMDAYMEVEGIQVGVPGAYWLLLENTSKQLPVPPPQEEDEDDQQAADERVAIADLMERLTLQSKRIRDLEQEKKRDAELWAPVLKGLELSARAFPAGTDLRERAGREAIRRRQRMDLLEQGVDMDVQCEADRAAAALAEVKRLERELAAVKEVAEAARVNLEKNAEMRVALREHNNMLNERNRKLVAEGDKAVAEWREVVARLRGRPSQREFARMKSELEATRGKLLTQIRETADVRQELDRLKQTESQAPPAAPLKRARTAPPPTVDTLDELRDAWRREEMEGPVGDDHDSDMEAMSKRTVRFAASPPAVSARAAAGAKEILVDARGPMVATLLPVTEVAQ